MSQNTKKKITQILNKIQNEGTSSIWIYPRKTEKTADEIYQYLIYQMGMWEGTVCCSHPKLSCNQEDMLVCYRDWIESKKRENKRRNN